MVLLVTTTTVKSGAPPPHGTAQPEWIWPLITVRHIFLALQWLFNEGGSNGSLFPHCMKARQICFLSTLQRPNGAKSGKVVGSYHYFPSRSGLLIRSVIADKNMLHSTKGIVTDPLPIQFTPRMGSHSNGGHMEFHASRGSILNSPTCKENASTTTLNGPHCLPHTNFTPT